MRRPLCARWFWRTGRVCLRPGTRLQCRLDAVPVVARRAGAIHPDQPQRDELDARPEGARRRRRRLSRQYLSRQHGRHRRAVPHARAVSLRERVPAARPRPVRRDPSRGARPGHSRGRPLRFEQDAEGGLRRASGMVLQADQRRAGDLQRPLFDVHQRELLPAARDDDSDRGARPVRGRRAVLQHVRQPGGRLQRQSDGALPVRGVPGALSRPLRPRPAGGGGCGLPGVHGGRVA